MKELFEPKKPFSPALRKVLKKFCHCLKHYDTSKKDIAYWYGERALTGLLASAAWMVRSGWSLEEFTGKRRKGRRANGSGKGDLWLGVGNTEYTIEAKVTWPTQVNDVTKWKKTVNGKLSKASNQLSALESTYRCGKPVAVCYVVPAIPSGNKELTNKTFSAAMREFAKAMTEANTHTEVIACWLNNVMNAPKDPTSKLGKRYAYPGIAVVVRHRDIWKFPA